MPLRPGNSKLGALVHQWSIPSGLQQICVGATALCLALCYAMRHHYCRSNVKNAMEVNYDFSLRTDFVQLMYGWIRSLFARVVRVHASGEFYNEEYVRKWIRIAQAHPDVTFYAYTRSWRSEDLLPALKELARQPNFLLWFSCDQETGAPPRYRYARRAYLMVDDTDLPNYRVDLVFRHRTSTVRKWVQGTLVCPAENGVTDMTCSKCQLCFKTRPMPRKDHTRCLPNFQPLLTSVGTAKT